MSNANLPRVDDLEKSPQWTILTNEINDLEQLCRLNNHRHPRRQPFRYNYYRYSMPQMQKATSVWIEPSNELNEDFQGNNEFSKYNTGETYRWNWRPKTEFERTYFFYDYDQGNLQHDTQEDYTPLHSNKTLSQNVNTQESDEYQTCHSSLLRSDRSQNSFNEGSFAQIYNRIYDNEPAYSGTRERLHEIFERNRYLRRKFFSSTPDDDTTNYISDFPKELENKNPSSTLKYNGFGSTETITSQSNQSSLSSNDRKSRCQSNVTTLEAEEDICNSEFSHKTSCSKSSVNVDHMEDGRIMSTTTNGKLLVNIESGNEVCQVNESTGLHNAVSMKNSTLNNSLVPSQKFNSMDNSKYDLDDVKQCDTVSQYESNAWTCYQHNLEYKNESKYQNEEGKISGSNEKLDQLSNSQTNIKYTTKDILQQRQETNKTNKSEKYESLSKNQNKDVYISNLKEQEVNIEPEDFKHSYRLQDNYKLVDNIVGSDLSISETNRSNGTPFNKDKTWMKDKFTSRATNRWDSLQNLCISLPNLSFYEKMSNSSDNNFTNNLATNLSLQCESKSGTKSELLMNIPNEQGRQENKKTRRYFASQVDLPNSCREPTSLTLRRVKIAKVPPPLDLFRVNEKYEEIEAFERKQLNTMNASPVRNYDRPIEGQATNIQDECSHDDNRRDIICKQKKSQKTSCPDEWRVVAVSESGNYPGRCNLEQSHRTKEHSANQQDLHKSYEDLTMMKDLQSPQLMSNYKNSISDLRTSGSKTNFEQSSQVAELETSQGRSCGASLFDHMNLISGPQARSGSTLPSVYGPIPYSQ